MTKSILLITRPHNMSEQSIARMDIGILAEVEVIYAPLITIVKMGERPHLGSHMGVIFTSSNGVNFAERGDGMAAYCVGENTAQRALAAGWDVKFIEPDAEQLVEKLSAQNIKGPLAHLSGTHRRGEIAERLGASGIHVDVHVLYDQPLRALTSQALRALSGEVPVILPLYSPRTAAHFARQVKAAPNTTMIAMSTAVAKASSATCFREVEVVSEPTGQEMMRSIEKWLLNNRLS